MDIDNNFRVTRLLDIYGEMLTNKQKDICKMFFFDNLTLVEIGEILSVSRQAIKDCIEKSTRSLEDFEDKIGKLKLLDDINLKLNNLTKKYRDSNLTKDIESILENID